MDDSLAKALSHPLRVEILDLLAQKTMSPTQLADALDEGLSKTSYHVNTLHKAGYIRLVKTVPRRGATEHFYEAAPVTYSGSLARREVPKSVRDHISAPILQKIIDEGVTALKKGSLDAHDDSHLSCISAVLDLKGLQEVSRIMDKALAGVSAVHARSAKRLAEAESQGIPATIIVASFESAEAMRNS